jgi:2-polyprenyl-3-methyl-5-hydroxy-6-metoxy-1,4-benzoquinol methylase
MINPKQLFYKQVLREFEDSGYNADKIAFVGKYATSGLKVLEVGCSDGYIGSLFLKKNNEVYGLDIDKYKVDQAKKRGVKARIWDIESDSLPYRNNYFDIVLLTDVIEHVFDTDQILMNIHSVLKNGGLLLVTTPNVASLARRIMLLFGINPHLEYSSRYMDFLPGSVGHIRYYTHGNLKHQLEMHNFRDVITRGDRVNFIVFSSQMIANLFPTFSVDILCTSKK